MTLAFDLFWSFRSPYSYLATARVRSIVAAYDVTCRLRMVYPIAVRIPGFFKRVNPLWTRYLMVDVKRTADMEGLPMGPPRPDPIVMNMATGEVAAEQPHIHRLTRLAVAADEAGRGLAFIDEVSRIIWGGVVDGWHEGSHLAEAAARAGLDLAALDHRQMEETVRFEAQIAENQQALETLGHWGVPTFGFEGEPFFGQDRISALLWRMEQRGLQRR
jgi:2-hydroxychromene-2-carboxylate isomerase